MRSKPKELRRLVPLRSGGFGRQGAGFGGRKGIDSAAVNPPQQETEFADGMAGASAPAPGNVVITGEGPLVPGGDAETAEAPVFSRRQVYGVLEEAFGFQEFREGQVEVIRSILGGEQTIAVLPTGAGKSLCYQLPALLFEGTSIVVSPLIALMRDQVRALTRLGIAAASMDSNQSFEERRATEEDFVNGRLKLLYVSPERLATPRFLELISGVSVPFVAIDEAHCVMRWGHDFRPAYLEIPPFLEAARPSFLAAFTATATPELREELGAALHMSNPVVYVRGFHRPNLHLSTDRMDGNAQRTARLVELVKAREGKAPALIYGATRAACEEAAAALRKAGMNAIHYHAGCAPVDRTEAQEAFLEDELDALVATNAFGMGIDKPDIRLLVHMHLPKSFEEYYQEFGRAGRDGLDSRAVLLWRRADYRTNDFLVSQWSGEGEADPVVLAGGRRRLHRIYEAMGSRVCIWRRVLQYFGDPQASALGDNCGSCSRCAFPATPARTLEGDQLTTVLTLLGGAEELHGRYGRKKVAATLRGSRAQGIPTDATCHGGLATTPLALIEALLQVLLDTGHLALEGSEYPLVALTDRGRGAVDGNGPIKMTWPESVGGPPPRKGRGRRKSSAKEAASIPDSPEERAAFLATDLGDKLQAWRRGKATMLILPAYVVLTDRSLAEVVAARPGSDAELLALYGFGPAKVKRYGADLLRLVREGS